MALEIERKFIVADMSFLPFVSERIKMVQGYLSTDANATVRVRIANDDAFITVKSKNVGAVRGEWEYAIPVPDALDMLKLCKSKIEKTRCIVPFGKRKWEIDIFEGANAGLVLAEVEIDSADEAVDIPPFLGLEVTGDPAYYNSVLAK